MPPLESLRLLMRTLSVVFLTPPLPPGREQRTSQICEIAENYGRFPQLGLLRLASIARKEGCDVSFIDAIAEGLTVKQIVSRVAFAKPDIVCLTLQTQILPHTVNVIRAIKAGVRCKVLVGGPHVELYPEETLALKE